MKKSKLQRKFVNQMRSMGDVPWPARKFKYPPTLSGVVGAEKQTHIGNCKRQVGEQIVRAGRLRRKKTQAIQCGGRVFLKRGSLGKRRVYCESCRMRREHSRQLSRMNHRITRLSPRQQAQEQRREVSRLKRLLRRGVR